MCIYIYIYIYFFFEKYNIMKVNLGCVFKCIYKHYILVLVTYMGPVYAYKKVGWYMYRDLHGVF